MEILDRVPEASVRLLALSLLDEAAAAAQRLRDDADEEALHDFRVALRRLRTLCKAYRDLLATSVSKKRARELRDLSSSTGASRDAEVQLEWLEKARDRLKPGAKKAQAWLAKTLHDRCEAGYSGVRGDALRRFTDLERRLRHGLSRYEATLDSGDARTFAHTLADTVQAHGVDLVEHMVDVRTSLDVEPAHEARIRGKRLRYLLEPLKKTAFSSLAAAVIDRVKALQETLGQLHDVHVLAEELQRVTIETAAERARTLHQALYDHDRPRPAPDMRAGLLAMAALVRDDSETLFQTLSATWDPARFIADVEALTAALHRHARRKHERRFLLARLPSVTADAQEVSLGFLPGKRVKERLRRVKDANGERYYRIIKAGSVHVEEETTREVFDRLWSLTEGQRLEKRSYNAADGWAVDEFLDRELYVAAVLAESMDEPCVIPAWLEPHVLREVTGDDAYQTESLAR